MISPDSLKSKVCGEEIDTAVENNKRLVPILFREPENGDPMPLDRVMERSCEIAGRNLTVEEWNEFKGNEVKYQPTCPELPLETDEVVL